MKTFYRIAALGDRPSAQEFETVEAACDAAKEALKEFPGGVFEIHKCVAMVQYTEASTFWMDGEGPPKKPRYRMLDAGETILHGDEYRWAPEDSWQPVCSIVGEIYGKRQHPQIRRPL